MPTNPAARLLWSRKFWLLVFAVFQTILFNLFPTFPTDVWKAIDGLIVFLILAIAYEDGQAKRNSPDALAEAILRLDALADRVNQTDPAS